MRPVVKRYWTFKSQVQYYRINLPEYGANIKFCLSMPKSWSRVKKMAMDGTPHMQRPDLDNLLKALLDAVFDEDCKVWNIGGLTKIWGEKGYIEIE